MGKIRVSWTTLLMSLKPGGVGFVDFSGPPAYCLFQWLDGLGLIYMYADGELVCQAAVVVVAPALGCRGIDDAYGAN